MDKSSPRIDQSYTINRIAEYLKEGGWVILFIDYPHSSRGGAENQGEMFGFLEKIKSPTPDILLYKDECVLIVEVDRVLNKELEVLKKYYALEDFYFEKIHSITGRKVKRLILGFGRFGITKNPDKIFSGLSNLWFFYITEDFQVAVKKF